MSGNIFHHKMIFKIKIKYKSEYMNNLKKAIICTDVENFDIDKTLVNTHIPKAGDVAIFEVLSIGKHKRLQCVGKINRHILPGDTIMATFGTRYATNQLEGYVPDNILEEYHILGQGGVVGQMSSIHQKYELRGPTCLRLIGYAVNEDNKVINTKYLGKQEIAFSGFKPLNTKIILSIGGAMDSGKTTTAAYLSRGLKAAGKKVGYVKLTGTVYTKDKDFVKDCGADFVTDFSDYGFPSTYMCKKESLMNLYQMIINDVSHERPDFVVIEIADGLIQRETNFLLEDKGFMSTIDDVIYSDGSSTGVLSGLNLLSQKGVVPFAVSGLFSAAPLLIKEVEAFTNTPVLQLSDLESVNVLSYLNCIPGDPILNIDTRTIAEAV